MIRVRSRIRKRQIQKKHKECNEEGEVSHEYNASQEKDDEDKDTYYDETENAEEY